MADKTEIDSVIANAKDPVVINQMGMPILLAPPGWTSKELQHLLKAPLHIKEFPRFNDIQSFFLYFEDFVDDNTRIFADDEAFEFTAIFDASRPGEPGHGFHRAMLAMDRSPEWDEWKKINGMKMDRNAFTRFLERNLEYIGGELTGAEIVEMCRELRVRGDSDMTVSENFEAGKRSLTMAMNHQVTGDHNGKEIPFPEQIEVNLRVFRNSDTYAFPVRLRWEVGTDGMSFRLDMLSTDIVEEGAFGKVIDALSVEVPNHPILKGAYRS